MPRLNAIRPWLTALRWVILDEVGAEVAGCRS